MRDDRLIPIIIFNTSRLFSNPVVLRVLVFGLGVVVLLLNSTISLSSIRYCLGFFCKNIHGKILPGLLLCVTCLQCDEAGSQDLKKYLVIGMFC